MKDFLFYIVKAGICLSIFLFVYGCFLRKMTFFRFNRVYLLAGLILSFIFPFLSFSYLVPVHFYSLLNTDTLPVSEIIDMEIVDKSSGSFSIWRILFILYIVGGCFMLGKDIKNYSKFLPLPFSGETSSEKYSIVDRPTIVVPFTVFKYIFINSEKLSGIEKETILTHEITHIEQKHWIDLVIGECARILQWFNPLVWLYVYYQKENHEFLVDETVLAKGVSPAVYQAVLINQQFGSPVFSFSSSFSNSKSLNRLSMMKKERTSSWKKLVLISLLPAFGMFFLVSAKPVYVSAEKELPTNNQEIGTQEGETFDLKNIPENIFILLDGKEVSKGELSIIPVEEIDQIRVLKDGTILKNYGEKGKNGVIEINTKNSPHFSMQLTREKIRSGKSGNDTISFQAEEETNILTLNSENSEYIIMSSDFHEIKTDTLKAPTGTYTIEFENGDKAYINFD